MSMNAQTPSGLIAYIRLVLVLLLVSSIALPELFQPFLTVLWTTLRNWSVYQWSTFETIWTVICYAATEHIITIHFIEHPESRLVNQHGKSKRQGPPKPKGLRRRGQEAMVYVAPLMLLDLSMIKKFADVPLEDMLRSGNYAISAKAASEHRSTFLVPSLHNFSLSSPLQTLRALPYEAPSSRRITIELFGSMVIYDALFFCFHLTMHIAPGLRAWHRPHHTHGEMHPRITNQLHIFERLGLVLLANFSLNIIGSHVLTRTLFVPLFVWLLVEIHSGLDLPWAYEKVLPRGWGG